MALYISPYLRHKLVVKPAKRTLVDGQLIRERGLKIQFNNGAFETNNEEVVKALDNYIEKSLGCDIQKINSEDEAIAKAAINGTDLNVTGKMKTTKNGKAK